MVRLENLTVRQAGICQLMWEMQTVEEVERFINSLPAPQQAEAMSMKVMLELAVIDDDVEQDKELFLAQEILDRF